MTYDTSHVVECPSERNRRRLQEICDRAGYDNISVTIAPNSDISLDGAVAEVVEALERFYDDGLHGRLIPDNDTIP